jgi:putative PIN family toxin of toxin-antitoxin system
LKIVLDTNVLISYALGNPEIMMILNHLALIDAEILADNRLMHEYKVIANRNKLKLTQEAKDNVNNWISKYICEIQISCPKVNFNPDRQDSKLIEIANSANCDYIISDDKPLVNRASHLTNAKLVTPELFFEIINPK